LFFTGMPAEAKKHPRRLDKAEGRSPTVVNPGAKRSKKTSKKCAASRRREEPADLRPPYENRPANPTPGEAKKNPPSKKPPRHSGLDPESSSSIKFLRRFAPEKTILDFGLSQQ
jgi:hypothetical protein